MICVNYKAVPGLMSIFLAKRLFVFAAVVLAVCLPASAQDHLPELVRRIKPSAVAIETFDTRGQSLSRGSGFFISNDRIITNRHVIERSNRVQIQLMDGRKFMVKGVLAVDGEGDLAMLQVDVSRELAVPLPIVRSVPQEGESIVVVGNPFGLEGSVSNGIVSAVRDISGYGRIIQITAPISPGSSGSPVVNMYGEVIGVATLQAAEGQSLNFAVPAERIMQMKVGELRSFSTLSDETELNKRAAAERYYSQGVARLSNDDYERALPLFQQAAELDPNYAEAWYQAGFSAGILGKHEDALKASQEAAKLRPEWPETHANIGASNFALKRFQEAADAYRRAIRLNDSVPQSHYALGLSLGQLNEPEQAALSFQRTLALKPDHVGAMEKLSESYLKQKKWREAAAMLEQLKAYKPEAKTYNMLGEAYLELDRTDESLNAFNNAVSYNPDFDQARYNLGRAYLKQGNHAMAAVQLEILRNAQSDWADRLQVLINP